MYYCLLSGATSDDDFQTPTNKQIILVDNESIKIKKRKSASTLENEKKKRTRSSPLKKKQFVEFNNNARILKRNSPLILSELLERLTE